MRNMEPKTSNIILSFGVHGFKGSGVQGCIIVHRLHLGCVFTRKAPASAGLIQKFGSKLAIILGK